MAAPRVFDYSAKTCEHCGRTFERPPTQRGAQWAARRWCSRRCHQQARSREARARWEQHQCPICGKTYGVRPGWPGVTCGKRACIDEWRRTIGAERQSERVKADYASGKRRRLSGFSPREQALWPFLSSHDWLWRLRWTDAVGSFELDFSHLAEKINVEIDGEAHRWPKQRSRDQARDAELTRRGWMVVRIQNTEVDADLEGVAKRILALA